MIYSYRCLELRNSLDLSIGLNLTHATFFWEQVFSLKQVSS